MKLKRSFDLKSVLNSYLQEDTDVTDMKRDTCLYLTEIYSC